jgi:hypothetical protein
MRCAGRHRARGADRCCPITPCATCWTIWRPTWWRGSPEHPAPATVSQPGRADPPAGRAGEAAAARSRRSAKRPKQVAPDPDIRATRQPGCAVSAARTSAIGRGQRGCRGFQIVALHRHEGRQLGHPCSGGKAGIGGLSLRARARNTAGVDTATPGLARTSQAWGRRTGLQPLAHAGHPGRRPGQADRHVGPKRQHRRGSGSGGPSAPWPAAPPPHPPTRRRCPRKPAAPCPA